MKSIKHCLTIAFTLLFTAINAQTFEFDGLQYSIIDSETKDVEVTKNIKQHSANIIIPETVNYEGVTYTVKFIGAGAFGYNNQITSVSLPGSIEIIRKRAFMDCNGLTSINLPENLKTIYEKAFSGCTRLTSIRIPKSVTGIKPDAFNYCFSLDSITVEEGNTVYDSRSNCNAIILTQLSGLMIGSNKTVIPDGIEIIGNGAFSGRQKLTNIVIPKSVTTIESHAFYSCTNLQSISLPENIDYINEGTFMGCTKLQSINIPEKVTAIASAAFEGCLSLKSIVIPKNVTQIEPNILKGCTSLESIVVDPDNKFFDSRDNCNAIISKANNDLLILIT